MIAAPVSARSISTQLSCGCWEGLAYGPPNGSFYSRDPGTSNRAGCIMLKPHLDLACVVTTLTWLHLGAANASLQLWNDSRLRTAVPKLRATGLSPNFSHIPFDVSYSPPGSTLPSPRSFSFLILCWQVQALFTTEAGQVAISCFTSVFCLHEYVTFLSSSRCWLPARLFIFLYILRGT
jgi:hypothetical protein